MSQQTRAPHDRVEEFKCRWSFGAKEDDLYFVAGVDEAGRGPLAGPVVMAACMVPPDYTIPNAPDDPTPVEIADSKSLTHEQRERAFHYLTNDVRVKYSIRIISHDEIDSLNILQATMKGMAMAVAGLDPQPKCVLIDGPHVPKQLLARVGQPDVEGNPALLAAKAVVGGDQREFVIAAASILAKVTRDHIMEELDKEYPGYGFAQHKGYGVPEHLEKIRQLGPCPIHRKSFNPVKTMLGWVRPKTDASAPIKRTVPTVRRTAGSKGRSEASTSSSSPEAINFNSVPGEEEKHISIFEDVGTSVTAVPLRRRGRPRKTNPESEPSAAQIESSESQLPSDDSTEVTLGRRRTRSTRGGMKASDNTDGDESVTADDGATSKRKGRKRAQ